MARHQVWNFHNPRLSIAQSGIRAVISHSLTGAGGPALLRSRVAAWSRGATGGHGVAMPSVGVCAGEPTMTAFGRVLEQIDEKKITNAEQASAAYVAVRSSLAATSGPAAPAALPAAGGAGTVVSGLGRDCMDLVAQYLLAWVFDNQCAREPGGERVQLEPVRPGLAHRTQGVARLLLGRPGSDLQTADGSDGADCAAAGGFRRWLATCGDSGGLGNGRAGGDRGIGSTHGASA